MENTFKKLSLIVASAAIFFVGAANVYAAENALDKEAQAYQRFVEVETGGDES